MQEQAVEAESQILDCFGFLFRNEKEKSFTPQSVRDRSWSSMRQVLKGKANLRLIFYSPLVTLVRRSKPQLKPWSLTDAAGPVTVSCTICEMEFFPSVTFKQALCGLENVARASINTRVVNKQVKCQFWGSYPFKIQPEPGWFSWR